MELPKDFRELLINIDSKGTRGTSIEVFEDLRKCVEAYKLDTSLPAARWEIAAFGFHCKHPCGIDPDQDYFRPLISLSNPDGTPSNFPDTSLIEGDTIDYWASRAQVSTSPLFRSRYADLVWHFSPQVHWSGKRADYARLAIASYLQMAGQPHRQNCMTSYDAVHRALHLAILIHDEPSISQARDTLLASERRYGVTSQLGTWGACYETLLEPKRIDLTPEQQADIICDIERRLAESSDPKAPQFDAFAAQRAARMLARHYRRTGQEHDLNRVMSSYRDAFDSHVRNGPAIVAAAQLAWVYADFKQFGITDGVEDLEAKIRRFGQLAENELGVFSQEIAIPVTEVNSRLDELVVDSVEESCARIAQAFIPSVDDARKAIAEVQKSAPIYAMVPISKMTSDGRAETSIGGADRDSEGRIVQHIAEMAQLSTLWLDLAMDRLFTKFDDNLNKIVGHLIASPLFRSSDATALASVLCACVRREFVLGVSALVPMIENAVRQLAELLGASTMKRTRDGGQHLRNLDELLTDDKIAEFWGEDKTIYLRTMLTDQRGWNIRNNVCHGILNARSFSSSYMNRLLHVCFVIALVRTRSSGKTRS
jgi:hypothetical protein